MVWDLVRSLTIRLFHLCCLDVLSSKITNKFVTCMQKRTNLADLRPLPLEGPACKPGSWLASGKTWHSNHSLTDKDAHGASTDSTIFIYQLIKRELKVLKCTMCFMPSTCLPSLGVGNFVCARQGMPT